jgi:hypothetical protein
MKRITSGFIKRTITALFIPLTITFTMIPASAQEKNAALLGYIIIPDIVQTMDRIGKTAAAVNPEKYNPGVIKAQAGAILGDPALDNIDRTLPVVIMLFKNTTRGGTGNGFTDLEYAAIIPVKDKIRYMKTLESMNLPCETNGEKIILGSKKSSLFFAQKEMKNYRELSGQTYSIDARMMVKIDQIMSEYNAGIELVLKQLQALENSNLYSAQDKQTESLIAIGKIFIYAMLDLASQSKDYQLDISLSETAIDFSSEYSSIPGSALNRFFDGEPQGLNKCLQLLPEKGQLTYAGYFDMKRFSELIDSLLAGVLKRDASLEKHINRDLINAYMDYSKLYLGEFAVAYGFNSNNTLQVNMAAATGSTGEEIEAANDRFMTIYNELLKKMDGGFSGMSGYTVQKNFRKSSGVNVNRYIMDMTNAKMSDMEKEMMQKMFGKEFIIEYAVSNGYIAASTDPLNLDQIIANTITEPAKTGLQSMEAFGIGMDSYADFDMISFIESIIELSGNTNAAEKNPDTDKIKIMLKKLDQSDRNILLSSKYSKGTAYSRSRISTRLITEFMKTFNEQKKEETKSGDSVEIIPEDESGE